MIVIEPPGTGDGGALFATLRKTALSRFLKAAQQAVGLSGEVNLLLADDRRIRELNRAFRRKNKPTDVLSFPAAENGEGMAGDLAISVETAARQAAEHGHSLEDELRVLTLHGVLHLAGHDHEADTGEMRALEAELRARLKLPAGLIERVEAAPVRKAPVKRIGKVPPADRAAARVPATKRLAAKTGKPRTIGSQASKPAETRASRSTPVARGRSGKAERA